MTICIIGAGPAGLFTAKNLLNFNPEIYDPSPLGKLKSHFLPSKANEIYKNKLSEVLSKCTLHPRKITNLNELPHCSLFVVAVGAEPKEGLGISYDELIEKKLNPKNAIILGMGDVSFDIARRLEGKVSILSKYSFYSNKFTNGLLDKLGKVNFNLRNFIDFFFNFGKNKFSFFNENLRRHEILMRNYDLNARIKFFYDAFPVEISKINDDFLVRMNDGSVIKGDCVINSTGYKPRDTNELIKGVDKPVFFVGACKNVKGNVGQIALEAEEVADEIKELLKK